MEESDRKLIQLKEEHESRKDRSDQEWQDIMEKLQKQKDHLRHSLGKPDKSFDMLIYI